MHGMALGGGSLELLNVVLGNARLLVALFVVLWLAVAWKRGPLLLRSLEKILLGFLAFLLVLGGAKTVFQYMVWSAGEVSRYFLPPYQPAYFFEYSFWRFFSSEVLAVGVAALFGFILWGASRRRGGAQAEILLGAILALAVGWPASLLLVGGTFVAMALWLLFLRIGGHREARAPLPPFALALALLLLIVPFTPFRNFLSFLTPLTL